MLFWMQSAVTRLQDIFTDKHTSFLKTSQNTLVLRYHVNSFPTNSFFSSSDIKKIKFNSANSLKIFCQHSMYFFSFFLLSFLSSNCFSLPVWHDAIKHPISLGPSSFVCDFLFSAALYLSFSSSVSLSIPEPGSTAPLVTLLLPDQIQTDYCKPVNLSESVAQWWQVTTRACARLRVYEGVPEFPLLPE